MIVHHSHTLPLEYDDLPKLVIKDFGKSIPKTPPNQIHHKHISEGGKGHPPNAPIRKSKSTSRVSKGRAATAARAVKLPPPPSIVTDEDDDFYEDSQDPDAIVPSATLKKRKRQKSTTPPPTQPASKKRRGLTPPPATLPLDINDGFYDSRTTTPPLSDVEEDDNNDDNNSYSIIENPDGTDGIHETKDGEDDELFEDEDERIEPSQAPPQKDQIIT